MKKKEIRENLSSSFEELFKIENKDELKKNCSEFINTYGNKKEVILKNLPINNINLSEDFDKTFGKTITSNKLFDFIQKY